MKTFFKIISIALLFLVLFFENSCKNDAYEKEMTLLYTYLTENNIEVEPTASGLYYIESGFSTPESISAETPVKGDSMIVVYKGYLLSDEKTIFAEKKSEDPGVYVYKKDDVIKGWEEALGHMKKGISAKVIMPSDLAYGDERTAIIPAYSTLIFEIRVIDIRK